MVMILLNLYVMLDQYNNVKTFFRNVACKTLDSMLNVAAITRLDGDIDLIVQVKAAN